MLSEVHTCWSSSRWYQILRKLWKKILWKMQVVQNTSRWKSIHQKPTNVSWSVAHNCSSRLVLYFPRETGAYSPNSWLLAPHNSLLTTGPVQHILQENHVWSTQESVPCISSYVKHLHLLTQKALSLCNKWGSGVRHVKFAKSHECNPLP